jgi:hypothetical protein
MANSPSCKSPFNPSAGPRLRKIAFLGWGSLVWDQRTLKTRGDWQENGPDVKVEFLRRSGGTTNSPQEYLSLVLNESGTRVQSLWAVADHDTLDGAKGDLWARETPTGKTGQAIHSWRKGEKTPNLIYDLDKWADKNGVEAVVWTGLKCKWIKNGLLPSTEDAIRWLKELRDAGKADFAEQYIRKAPRQIDTAYRQSFIRELGWVPARVKSDKRWTSGLQLPGLACAIAFIVFIGFLLGNRRPHLADSPAPIPPPQAKVAIPVLDRPVSAPIAVPLPVATPPPARSMTLAELTNSDTPSSIVLRKAGPSYFKKGMLVTLKEDSPLFFGKEFLRTGKKGERFEILDYRPEKNRIYGRYLMPDGKVIAVNFLEYRVGSEQAVSLPTGTTVSLDKLSNSNALVSFEGFKFSVPVSDTDLLDRATRQRDDRALEVRRRIQAQELENQAKAEAERQIASEREKQEATPPLEPQRRSAGFAGWTAVSNGRTWNSAPDSAKQNLCNKMAAITQKGNSAAFYYDAFSTFFDTDDPHILNTSLDGASKLIEASSSSLPLSQRNY